MAKYLKLLHLVMRDDDGQDLIEYALVIGLIGLAAITSLKTVANNISDGFQTISSRMTAALA